jgi:tRNA synthetases class II (A)
VPSASLIPDEMSTTLFTIAGMEQFVPVFLGDAPAPAPRAVTVERCLRVAGAKSDIENVGVRDSAARAGLSDTDGRQICAAVSRNTILKDYFIVERCSGIIFNVKDTKHGESTMNVPQDYYVVNVSRSHVGRKV